MRELVAVSVDLQPSYPEALFFWSKIVKLSNWSLGGGGGGRVFFSEFWHLVGMRACHHRMFSLRFHHSRSVESFSNNIPYLDF